MTRMDIKKPVRRRSLSRQVSEAMEEMIRRGRWQVGERIPSEPELAKSFSVSHNTLREAVQSLIHAGMLEARPGDGTYVLASDRLSVAMNNRLSESELSKILEARLALEKEIARLAAANRTEDDLRRMGEALAQCHRKSGTGIDDDMHFHACVADATHNPVLSELYGIIIRYIQQNLGHLLEEKQYDAGAMALHDELIKAIARRDAAHAGDIVERIVQFDTQSIEGA